MVIFHENKMKKKTREKRVFLEEKIVNGEVIFLEASQPLS